MHTTPAISLDHLDRLTDSTGLIQHAIYSVPRRQSGYTVDDNARALSLCVRLWSHQAGERMLDRVTKYLSLLEDSRRSGGGFHNLMSYQRQWLDTDSSGDCQGQAIRSLSEVLASRLPQDLRTLAHELIESALPAFVDMRSLRAEANLLVGYGRLWEEGTCCWQRFDDTAAQAAQHLAESFRRSRRPSWHWFESRMTYANAVLPHAMFVAASRWPNEDYLDVAQESLAFLDLHTTEEGMFWPVGNNGWFAHGETKARYDQQPIEASTMADATLAAWRVTRDERHRRSFEQACRWFHGENSVRVPMAHRSRGACYDGLHASGPNRNQGAESTLAFLWSELCEIAMVPTVASSERRPASPEQPSWRELLPHAPIRTSAPHRST